MLPAGNAVQRMTIDPTSPRETAVNLTVDGIPFTGYEIADDPE